MALKKAGGWDFLIMKWRVLKCLFSWAACVFSDCFCSFWDCVFGKFTWKNQFNSTLNFSGAHCVFFVISNQFWCFLSKSFKWITNEWVHNWHGFFWNSGFMMNLFQNFVNVDSIRLNSFMSSFFFNWFFWGNFSNNWCSFFGNHFNF